MKVKRVYLVSLAAVVVLYMLSKTEKGQQVVSGAADAIASGVIGFRLNNPFNIERGENWAGLAPEQLHDRFATFVAAAYGVRAWHKIMQTYRTRYGITTVRGIVDRFNPKSDGQPASYIPALASALGVGADAVINIMEPVTAFKLARAMMRVEIGAAAALLVSDATVREGLRLAGVNA